MNSISQAISQSGFQTIDFVILVCYLILLVSLGLFLSRNKDGKEKSANDYFLAGNTQCGYKVGLYTSPHLVDFRERIRVNGVMISEEYVVNFVEKERSFFEPLSPSFFEVTTAMAFKYFSDKQVDIAVIEVGLGGRLDCTNIITPLVSVITNISFDHTQFLGDTLAKIASEKAGIIKPSIPVVIGESSEETRPVFEAKAKETKSFICFADDNPEVREAMPLPNGHMQYITEHWGTLTGELGGIYQQKNLNTVFATSTTLPPYNYCSILFVWHALYLHKVSTCAIW